MKMREKEKRKGKTNKAGISKATLRILADLIA
jgi:hypothetical protein